MITKEMTNSILEHKGLSKVLILKDFCKDTPSWGEFIDYLDKGSSLPNVCEPNDYDLRLGAIVKGSVMGKQSFYFYVSSIGDFSKTTKDISESISKALGVVNELTSVYINISSNIDNVPNHTDMSDNFYWQCIGSTTWTSNDQTYVVNPGDLVFIPANTSHAVTFSMPRAAIGFTSDIDIPRKI